MLKKQALAYLSKNNWGTAICGFFLMILPFLLIILVSSTIITFMGIFTDIEKMNILTGSITLGIEFLSFVTFIMLTPVFTGYLRLCYNISKGKNSELSDVFYYFKGSLYGKCLGINIRIIARIAGYFIVFGIPALLLTTQATFTESGDILLILAVIYFIILLICTLFWSMKYTVIPCILFEDESLSASEIVKLGISFAKPRVGTINMLTLTFFPYFLLCFFVIPWIFVAPFLCVTYMTNGKWITEMHLVKK